MFDIFRGVFWWFSSRKKAKVQHKGVQGKKKGVLGAKVPQSGAKLEQFGAGRQGMPNFKKIIGFQRCFFEGKRQVLERGRAGRWVGIKVGIA